MTRPRSGPHYWQTAARDAGAAAREAQDRLSALRGTDPADPRLLEEALGCLRAAANSARFALVALNDQRALEPVPRHRPNRDEKEPA